MADKAQIKEIFTSIQGEGPFVGYKQLFVRFCGCNLNCEYCDTDFSQIGGKSYTKEELINITKNALDCHSVSLTGGEPLLQSGFLKEFLPHCVLPVYLETNATMSGELNEIIDYIDYISADIKLPSCTGGNDLFNDHDRFFEIASHKMLFAKVVFDENITGYEITHFCSLGAKYRIEIILQPRMIGREFAVDKAFCENVLDKCLEKYKKVRLIPQVHKFIDVK